MAPQFRLLTIRHGYVDAFAPAASAHPPADQITAAYLTFTTGALQMPVISLLFNRVPNRDKAVKEVRRDSGVHVKKCRICARAEYPFEGGK
jgi:hypothetical protein